ncbi:MAG: hypothetical protein M0Z94_02330 [Dehalococcoidales bacterium]|nr:hypothetical protein [Dehalococcoidales bacterium]
MGTNPKTVFRFLGTWLGIHDEASVVSHAREEGLAPPGQRISTLMEAQRKEADLARQLRLRKWTEIN